MTPRSTPPVAVVVETRRTIGTTTIVEVQCPFARHRHTVGLTDDTAVLWCTYGAGHYRVAIEDTQQ